MHKASIATTVADVSGLAITLTALAMVLAVKGGAYVVIEGGGRLKQRAKTLRDLRTPEGRQAFVHWHIVAPSE